MPRSPSLEDIPSEARRQQKAYKWLTAAELYKKASEISLKSSDLLKTSELHEKTGLCYRLASMQADIAESFAERLRLAAEAYKNAADLYERIGDKEAKACQCLATIAYINYWLAPSPVEKKEWMDECNRLRTKVFELHRKAGDQLGSAQAYNELLMCLCESDSDRCTLEWDWSRRDKMIREALTLGEKAIITFSELEDDHELAKAYSATGKLYETARHICESETEKRSFGEKGWNYLRKGVELSMKAADDRLLCLVNIWLGISTADWAGNLVDSLKCFEDAMNQATKLGDHYLQGHAAHCLAYSYYWKCRLEQDPEKRKEMLRKAIDCEEEALRQLRIFSFVPVSFWILPDSYSSLAEDETDSKARHAFLEKAVDVGRESLMYAEHSGSFPRPDWGVYHGLSKALYYLAVSEVSTNKKKQLCEEALKHREESVRITEKALPFDYWNRGVFRNYLALLNAELASIETDKTRKKELLEKAVQNMEVSLESCSKRLQISPKASLYVTLGKYLENYAKILNQLYLLIGDVENVRKAIKAHEDSIEAYRNVDWPSRVAEAYWQIATLYNKLAEYQTSAKSFEDASQNYRAAAEKIVPLKEFYLDHAAYMQTWREIESAKHCHDTEEYAQSKAHYQKTADLYESLTLWRYLAPNYSAWAQLENGEDLSRKEKGKQAVKAFELAAELFAKAKKTLEEAVPRIQSQVEKDKADELMKASEIRKEYCIGRMLLEEGKICNGVGNTQQSAEKYGLAAKVFQKVADALATESEREELLPIVYSCQAWEKMKLGEQKVLPDLFLQSSELFQKAKEHSSNEKASLLALGNSAFCRALEAGTKFEATRDLTMYSVAKQNMESSANYYLKAGFEKASLWVNASEALLDAYFYMSNAEAEIAHEKKLQLYQIAEKYLERSVSLYEKAGYEGKKEEALKVLKKVQEKRKFALTLSEALRAPSITSSTAVISVPSPTHEEAVGLEKFEHASIQAYLAAPEEVTVGETFEVRLDMANIAKEPALLVRVESLVPSNFTIAETVPQYKWEGGSMDVKGKRLEPQKVDSVRIRVIAPESGISHLSPRILYVDDLGKFKTCQPEPAVVTVYLPGKFQFKTNSAQKVFEYLTNAFVEDSMRRKLALEKSGWRTLMQIAKKAEVTRSSVYGATAHRGPAISELEARGVAEVRIFTEERGRGGKIAKARIAYENDIIKRYIDLQVMKNKQK